MEILGLSIWEFIFTIFNFCLLLFLLKKFLYKPIMKMLDDRKASINEALDAAEAARLEAAQSEENIRNEIAKARTEADAIIADAKKRGEEVKNEIVNAAKLEAKSITDAAAAQIEKEKAQAIHDLKTQIADIAILATEKLLTQNLTLQQEKILMDNYIKEVGQIQ